MNRNHLEALTVSSDYDRKRTQGSASNDFSYVSDTSHQQQKGSQVDGGCKIVLKGKRNLTASTNSKKWVYTTGVLFAQLHMDNGVHSKADEWYAVFSWSAMTPQNRTPSFFNVQMASNADFN